MELQAITGQLYLLEGVVQEVENIPGLLAQPAPKKAARGRERDTLFVHLSLGGPPDSYAQIARPILDLIRDTYYQSSGSVTAALRQAILAANQYLLRLNMNSKGPGRQGAIMCAVLRGQELFLVQAGEAFALIARNFGVERLPDKEPHRITPLGLTAGLDLRYFHNWFEPGDMLLLADPRLTNLPTEATRKALVDSTVEESLPLLKQIIGQETARLLLVEFIEEAPVYLHQTEVPAVTSVATSIATTQPRRATRAAAPQYELDDVETARPRGKLAFPQPTLPAVNVAGVETTARQASSRAAWGMSVATGWLADLMSRLRPARPEQGRPQEDGWALPALLAVLIPIIVAVIVTGVYVERGRVQRISQIKREMSQALGLASQSESDSERREYYNQVLVLAAEAQLLRPNDGDVQQLRQTALVELDLIDDVTRLLGRPLYTYTPGSRMAAIALREGLNGDIYVLDEANNQVWRHETSEDYMTLTGDGPSQVLFGGQAVGNHITGRIVDMLWRANSGSTSESVLAMLDANGAVINFSPGFGELRASRVGLASEWQNPVSMTRFNERFYVLDRGAGVIWRYFTEGGSFIVDEAQRTIELPDLDQAVDFAIYSEDGSIIVLYADGRLRRYAGNSVLWDEVTLRDSGLTTPLIAPVRLKIIGRGLNSSIFVADPGSARVVQLSLGGTFLAQYKALDLETDQELFARMSDFDVAEAPLRIFITVPEALYVATQD